MKIIAPYPEMQVICYLPNPILGDTLSIAASLQVKTSLNGSRRTFIKRKNRKKLTYRFNLTRNKALELATFIEKYRDNDFKIVDHESQTWVAKWLGPEDITAIQRGPNLVEIDLEFEGRLL